MNGNNRHLEATPARLASLSRLPLFFSLQGKTAVVAGGSAAAAWKAELLSAAGATVSVFAVEVSDQMEKLARGLPGVVAISRRVWRATDLQGAALAIGDFEDDKGASAFRRAARAAGVPLNVIDKPAFCDFSFGAIVNRSPLVVGISTDGAAPTFAQAVRGKIEALLPTGFALWTAAAAQWRDAVKAAGLSFTARRRFWQLFAAHAMANPDVTPGPGDFSRFAAVASLPPQGSVTRIVVQRGDADSLTLRELRALQLADVILFDPRVPHEVLDFARREARKIAVDRDKRHDLASSNRLDELSTEFAAQGKHVAVIAIGPGAARLERPLFSAA